MREKAAVCNNAICYGSTFVKATDGVPVEIVNIRGLRRRPAAVKVTGENTARRQIVCCGYIAANKSAVCSMTGLVAFENIVT